MRPATLDLPARFLKPCFDELALLLTLKGENAFKVRAFERGAELLEESALSVGDFLNAVEVGNVRGFGKGLHEVITQLIARGSCDALDELRQEFPKSLLQLLDLPGLGPRKLATLHGQLGISSIADLQAACARNEVASLKGFGEKTQANFAKAILELKSYEGLCRIDAALTSADAIMQRIKQAKGVSDVQQTGALRRSAETFRELEFVVAASAQPIDLKDAVQLAEQPCVLHPCQTDLLGLTLLRTTGSEKHRQALERHAIAIGVGSLQNKEAELSFAGLTEAEIFTRLKLAYIPPEIRESGTEVEQAAKLFDQGKEFPRLVQLEDLRGILHAHSTYSDGKNTLEEMARAVQQRGYGYFGICDHSQSSFYAGGLAPERVRMQHKEIDRLNEMLAPFRIFKGIEADILPNGELDYDRAFLGQFDFVVASVHSAFSQDREQMTNRVCSAIKNPAATILGHATGRLLLERRPYAIDLERVLDVAAANGVAIEINSNPYRLELAWEHLRAAKDRGIKLAITPDAHSISQIDYVRYGVMMARKGELQPSDILNAIEHDKFAAYLETRKQRAKVSRND